MDAIAETDYTGWYDTPSDTPARQRAVIAERLAAMHRTFPGKVLVISEFGAESNSLNSPGSPGSFAFQTALLVRHISVYARDRWLSGMLIWNLRDYPLNPTFEGGSIHTKGNSRTWNSGGQYWPICPSPGVRESNTRRACNR